MNFAQHGKEAHRGALLLLGCALIFAGYRWQFAPRAHAAAGLASLSRMLKLDSAAMPKPQIASARSGATVPELLSRIQEIAGDDGVAIRSVTPSPVNPDQLAIGADGAFRDVTRFLARLETLQITISSFDLAPGAPDKVAATIGIVRAPKPGAPESFADYIDAISLYSAVRNPFEIGDPITLPNTGPDLGDLSWTYHLTSISLLGGERVATIDGKDFVIGDTFNGMTVIAIGPSSVSLSSPKKAARQVLHFRHNPEVSLAAQ